MVKLKSSFDKSWADVNEIRKDGNKLNSLEKTGSEKGEPLSQRYQIARRCNFIQKFAIFSNHQC